MMMQCACLHPIFTGRARLTSVAGYTPTIQGGLLFQKQLPIKVLTRLGIG